MKFNKKLEKLLNKKTKIIFILLFVLFFTGCNVDYNVLVDDKKQVQESIRFVNSNDNILVNNEDVDLYLTTQIDAYKKIPLFKNYRFSKKIGKTFSYVTSNRRFSSLEEYRNSPVFNHLFEYAEVTNENGIVTFKTTGKYYYENAFSDNYDDPLFFINSITIKMKFYNNIIDSNADMVDKKNNVLIWNINSNNTEKTIYFKIGKDKRYDIIILDYVYRNQTNIIIGMSIIVIIVLLTLIIQKKIKKNNIV